MSAIEKKVHVPPRRRSAVITVELDERVTAKATVNARTVRLAVKPVGRYAQESAITLPRDVEALAALGSLVQAIAAEVVEQEALAAEDAMLGR